MPVHFKPKGCPDQALPCPCLCADPSLAGYGESLETQTNRRWAGGGEAGQVWELWKDGTTPGRHHLVSARASIFEPTGQWQVSC
jgi:hypothetical protein